VERLPAFVETNRLGTTRASLGPGYVELPVYFSEEPTRESPPDADDRQIAPEEIPALREVASELNLQGLSEERVLDTLTKFFTDRFQYSTWRSDEHRARSNRTALAAFLLDHRSGHCEYFATATTLLLREAGIPARYVVGYSVQEQRGRTWIIRQRHGHAWSLAWINGAWRNVDNTPPSWHEIENGQASAWESISDLWSRVRFALSKWRWTETGLRKYLIWIVAPLVLTLAARLFLKRQWNRSKTRENSSSRPAWPGLDSEFYEIERQLNEAGLGRAAGESWRSWLSRVGEAGLIDPAELQSALALHYRLRFDPAGLTPEERTTLKATVESWSAARTEVDHGLRG
jgi:hypothetical protein